MTRLFSTSKRPVHLGPYPMERLARLDRSAGLGKVPAFKGLEFRKPGKPLHIANAMVEYQAMMDALRDGATNKVRAECPEEVQERANHLKAFGYFNDASLVGVAPLEAADHLPSPVNNPDVARLAKDLQDREAKSFASGVDQMLAELREAMLLPPRDISRHTHALVFVYEYSRDPVADEPGTEWIMDAQEHRACLRATETAVVVANYIRALGWQARAHTPSASEVDLNRLVVSAGLATVESGALVNPYVGDRFGMAVVTTDFEMEPDAPLASAKEQSAWKAKGPNWWLGTQSSKSALNKDAFAKRRYVDGAHPFETLKRVEAPTTFIDEPNVARVPKRTDMFARALFGDMGKTLQENARGGFYVRKAATSMAQRSLLSALMLLQDGPVDSSKRNARHDPGDVANAIKATCYFLGVDAVGISRCPDWAWYSHDAQGVAIEPPHDQAISMIVDQGYETMAGSSGDDWIAVSQSMRAYLRFSVLGGVIAQQIRSMGYSAKAHTVMDGGVLQPPLLLLSGLGEISRIGEVILNPFLGPRLKSGVVTTDMPLAHDKPIDFGLQRFCESCNKCARECPSGAITAGPKLMFNGYEIWKSDSQKCATYRITTPGGAMCGRCMKTCPWNLEGLFAEAPFRWAAMNMPSAAPALAKLDDALGKGGLNPVKKWWWDLKIGADGGYKQTDVPVNQRDLQKDLDLKYEDQTLAVYPAPLAPPPWPYPYPMDREAGIEAYQAMITAEEYQARAARGETEHIHKLADHSDSPVVQVRVAEVDAMVPGVTRYRLEAPDGSDLPEWTAGAHLDVVVAPEYLRQYSMSGDPADRGYYEIGVLREDSGRGGSSLLHRIFKEGRTVFVSRPINHFPLVEEAERTFLMGGGIGITPMIAMAHRLHALGRPFELHYSISSRQSAGYLDRLASVPWADHAHVHVSDEGTRADLGAVLGRYSPGFHVYTCGPDRYMDAVIAAAEEAGFPEDARHLEYFSVPDLPDYENHSFTLKLARSGKTVDIPADKSATDVLAEIGVHVDVKCSDGICGVCKCGLVSGDVEHRDFVLSNAQRRDSIILCQSRAAKAGGAIEIDL